MMRQVTMRLTYYYHPEEEPVLTIDAECIFYKRKFTENVTGEKLVKCIFKCIFKYIFADMHLQFLPINFQIYALFCFVVLDNKYYTLVK